MDEGNVTLRMCCNEQPEIYAEAPAHAKCTDQGEYESMWFTDVPWYWVECPVCGKETDRYTLVSKAIQAWNEHKLNKWSM